MQPNSKAMMFRIAQKEVTLFFSSPIAYLFLATFAIVSLFIFFWGEAFFARNIADIRPLFEWMPLLLIFLASTLTMRLWSEEKRTGTIEYVLTQPIPIWQFTVGKFLGCLVLLAIALAITLPLPISVAMMSSLDWGPVIAGYLATFLLGAAYLSIGLFVSARSENQIVSLITSVAIGALFYLVGSSTITALVSNDVADVLRAIGTGSRFSAITRGMIDMRDLYYYLSVILMFLSWNTLTLEQQRWSQQQHSRHQHWRVVTLLLIANAIFANITLHSVTALRLDVTEGKQYSISQVTKNYLGQLQEPLLIRGYFSSKTHPLLAPLVPQLKDLLAEYQIAGGDKVHVEIIDPAEQPALEQEANEKYGIKPVPFQIADRYQSSIVSSYFNVLIAYGDEHKVLGFNDLIEVKAKGENIDVQLRNPEHDLTTAIKKVLNSYQSSGNLFDTVKHKLTLTGYISADDKLPQSLRDFKKSLDEVVQEFSKQAGSTLSWQQLEPEADAGKVARQIASDYGFEAMATSILSPDRFYFYLTLSDGEQIVQIPIAEMNKEAFKRDLKAGIQRFAQGFSKNVAVVAPSYNPQLAQYGMAGPQFRQLQQYLGSDLHVQQEDLSDGRVSGDADILLLLAPKDLDEKQVFAIDQFLMQGGTVIAATSPYSADFSRNSLNLQSQHSGLEDWLAHYGLSMASSVVMDPQNASLPVPVTRNVGGFQLQEMRMLDYPYFVDVRDSGLNQHNPVSSGLPQAMFAWSSPIIVDQDKQGKRQLVTLAHSTDQAWLSSSTDIMPKLSASGDVSYSAEGKRGEQTLALISSGVFDSYFADKQSPLLSKEEKKDDAAKEDDKGKPAAQQPLQVSGVIKHSPESARIILFASNDFLRDQVNQMAGAANGSNFINNYQLLANTLDWALDDQGLSSIRARGHFNRTLPPMDHGTQLFWEYLNYVLAALALALVALLQRQRKRAKQRYYQLMLAN